jgi:hypothetical protein
VKELNKATLLPCPFCGDKEIGMHFHTEDTLTRLVVWCMYCKLGETKQEHSFSNQMFNLDDV